MVDSYFDIVKKSLGDTVPKAVSLQLIEEMAGDLEVDLLTELDNEATMNDLMATSPEVLDRIEKSTRTLALLEEAMRVVASF